jgi:hypothetical protein
LAGWVRLLDVDVFGQRQPDLLEIVGAAGAAGTFAGGLNRRQQQAYQHPDDGDDDEQLDQGKRSRQPRPPPAESVKSQHKLRVQAWADRCLQSVARQIVLGAHR